MSKTSWGLILALVALLFGVAVWTDKGSYLNLVMTGQCFACPAPKPCTETGPGRRFGRPPAITGCGHPWWKRA